MATPTLIPVSEYLRTSYDPDRDYLEGELEERDLGERPHSATQAFFLRIFGNHRRLWAVREFPELRVQVGERRYRVADVCICRATDPPDDIVIKPPLVCIEVMSSGQTLAEHQGRVDDYAAMGVEAIWVIDPIRRKALLGTADGYQTVTNEIFTVAGTPIRIPLADLWAELDDLAAGRV